MPPVATRPRGRRRGSGSCPEEVAGADSFRRKKPQLGHGRALGAVKHSMICACWHMLTTGELYRDLGGDYYSHRNPERQTRRLVAQPERLGHTVTLREVAA